MDNTATKYSLSEEINNLNEYNGGDNSSIHQISTTVTSNRSSINSNVNNSFKLKQQRNSGNNRYDPLGKNQIQTQWNNSILSPSHYSTITNPYQQQADYYTQYYAQQSSYQTANNIYSDYGQQIIAQESSKGGHIIYIYGIGQKPTQEQLVTLFQPYGNVLRVDIIIDFNTGLCKGYAFVAMEEYQQAQMAILNLNGTHFNGRQLQVRFKT